MAFLNEQDYTVQVRTEISKIIDPTLDRAKLIAAEKMAIDQIKNHIAGRCDITKIFVDAPATGQPDERDMYIVMLTIDIALYHLWCKEGGNNIPKTRELRYNDALKWLQDVQRGKPNNLPQITNDEGVVLNDVKIWSRRKLEDQQY